MSIIIRSLETAKTVPLSETSAHIYTAGFSQCDPLALLMYSRWGVCVYVHVRARIDSEFPILGFKTIHHVLHTLLCL